MVYSLKKTFHFKNAYQANAFLEIANVYGKGRAFGSAVIFKASLEFTVWRKIQNLAREVMDCNVHHIDIYKMTQQAGFKVFQESSL